MPCPPNPIPANLQEIVSGAFIPWEGSMRGGVAPTRCTLHTNFPTRTASGKKGQIFSHVGIQPSPYLRPGSTTSPAVFYRAVQFCNPLTLQTLLDEFQNEFTKIFPNVKSVLLRCNLSARLARPGSFRAESLSVKRSAIKDLPVPVKFFVFSLTLGIA
jgi:hypothetical protein